MKNKINDLLKNRTVLGICCIVLSLIICFGLTPIFNNSIKSTAEVVRVNRDISKGDLITNNMIENIKVGGYNLPQSVIRDSQSVVGKYATVDMKSGDFIFKSKITENVLSEFEYLTELDGTQQAISVTVKSLASGLSGKLESGDIVTIIASDYGELRETIMPMELRYVKVLAVTDANGNDKKYTDSEDNDEKQLASTVTLLVASEQSKLLADLEANANIHFSLVYRGMQERANLFLKTQEQYLNNLLAGDTKNE